MELRVISGARVLVSADGTNRLFIDTGSEVIPIASPASNTAEGAGADAGADAGTDGGYYTPRIDESTGVITWTASKPNMPAISPSNIRGPAGRSVFGINISVDAAGDITGGTVFYDDGSTSKITFSLSEA